MEPSFDETDPGAQPPLSSEQLLYRLRELRAEPFAAAIVQSPWSRVVDVPTFQTELKSQITEILDTSQQEDVSRCLTVRAAKGYGKTHLLAWTNQFARQERDFLFVYVPPFTAESRPFEDHCLRSLIDSLKQGQMNLVEDRSRQFLARAHDKTLNMPKWSIMDLFRSSHLKLQDCNPPEQREFLRNEMNHAEFFRRTFKRLQRLTPPTATGLHPDIDGYTAWSLYFQGDEEQRVNAEQWFTSNWMTRDERRSIHIVEPCQGIDKIQNVIFTLYQMTGLTICFAVDQIEDFFIAIRDPDLRKHHLRQFSGMVRALCETPGFCFVFMIQMSLWDQFKQHAPPNVLDRMLGKPGRPQPLPALSSDTACKLVQARMHAYVWGQLEDCAPPEDNPLFPFSQEEIHTLRTSANRELREFLKQLQSAYQEKLTKGKLPEAKSPGVKIDPPPRPAQTSPESPPNGPEHRIDPPVRRPTEHKEPEPPPIRGISLSSANHNGDPSSFPTRVYVYGNGLSQPVEVLFNGTLQRVLEHDQARARIIVEAPSELQGNIQVKVVSKNDPNIFDTIVLHCPPPSKREEKETRSKVDRSITLTAITREPPILSRGREILVLHGENLLQALKICFEDAPAREIEYDNENGCVRVEVPGRLSGLVSIHVASASDDRNFKIAIVDLSYKNPRRPYADSLNGARVQQRREQLGLSPDDVANQISRGKDFLLAIERDAAPQAVDSNYENLAKALNCSIADFWDGKLWENGRRL